MFFRGFGNQIRLSAAAISRQIPLRLGACPGGTSENLPSPAPSPQPLSCLQDAVGCYVPQRAFPCFSCWSPMEKLPALSNYFMPFLGVL